LTLKKSIRENLNILPGGARDIAKKGRCSASATEKNFNFFYFLANFD